MKLTIVRDSVGGYLIGADCEIRSFQVDPLKIAKGDAFVATVRLGYDTHECVDLAIHRGASCVLVSRQLSVDVPQLIIENTVEALGKLAGFHRKGFKGKVIAVTGSCGKTTVKEMIKSILDSHDTCLATFSNANCDVGVPITLLELSEVHNYAVVEAGALRKGDIGYLTEIIKPDVALVTNVKRAHLINFGTLDAIASEKTQIYANDRTVPIVNFDEKKIIKAINKNIISNCVGFTLQSELDTELGNYVNKQRVVHARDIVLKNGNPSFNLTFGSSVVRVDLGVMGLHNVYNAVAAAACALALNINIETIKIGLEKHVAQSGRLQLKKGFSGFRLIDDTFKANPDSYVAALEVLSKFEKTLLVSGDIDDLGSRSDELYYWLGLEAKKYGVNKLYLCGHNSQQIMEGFGGSARSFGNQKSLYEQLKKEVTPESTVLVIGRRQSRMDMIVDALLGGI